MVRRRFHPEDVKWIDLGKYEREIHAAYRELFDNAILMAARIGPAYTLWEEETPVAFIGIAQVENDDGAHLVWCVFSEHTQTHGLSVWREIRQAFEEDHVKGVPHEIMVRGDVTAGMRMAERLGFAFSKWQELPTGKYAVYRRDGDG